MTCVSATRRWAVLTSVRFCLNYFIYMRSVYACSGAGTCHVHAMCTVLARVCDACIYTRARCSHIWDCTHTCTWAQCTPTHVTRVHTHMCTVQLTCVPHVHIHTCAHVCTPVFVLGLAPWPQTDAVTAMGVGNEVSPQGHAASQLCPQLGDELFAIEQLPSVGSISELLTVF